MNTIILKPKALNILVKLSPYIKAIAESNKQSNVVINLDPDVYSPIQQLIMKRILQRQPLATWTGQYDNWGYPEIILDQGIDSKFEIFKILGFIGVRPVLQGYAIDSRVGRKIQQQSRR